MYKTKTVRPSFPPWDLSGTLPTPVLLVLSTRRRTHRDGERYTLRSEGEQSQGTDTLLQTFEDPLEIPGNVEVVRNPGVVSTGLSSLSTHSRGWSCRGCTVPSGIPRPPLDRFPVSTVCPSPLYTTSSSSPLTEGRGRPSLPREDRWASDGRRTRRASASGTRRNVGGPGRHTRHTPGILQYTRSSTDRREEVGGLSGSFRPDHL